MKPLILTSLLLASASSLALPSEASTDGFNSGTIIDLTYAFGADTIYWPTAPGFELKVDFKGATEGGYYYEANSFSAAEHGGTHLDAPSHFAEGGEHTDAIPLDHLIGPAVVIDVSRQAVADRDYLVSIADFEAW